MSKTFEKRALELGIILSEKQKEQFRTYYELLIEWNKVMNLTSITDCDEVYKKHFLDSISVVKVIPLEDLSGKKELKILDVGTGAGFPGIPLKILFPDVEIVLLDSLNKRIKFLETTISKLQLTKIEAVHGRAEDFAKKEVCREQFDYVVSRAVANLAILSEYCIPFVKVGGRFISYKSGEVDKEVEESKNAIHILGGAIECVEKFHLPGSEMARSFVKIIKMEQTNEKYPRKAGKPEKQPLS